MTGLFDQPFGDGASVRDSYDGHLRRVRHSDLCMEIEDAAQTVVVLNVSAQHRVTGRFDGRWSSITPAVGSVTVLPAGARCCVEVSGECRILLARVPSTLIEAAREVYQAETWKPALRVNVEDEALTRALCGSAASEGGSRLDDVAVALLAAAEAGEHLNKGGVPPHRLRRVLALIRSDPRGDLSLRRLAEEAGMSLFHFAHAFRLSTGFTPHAWIIARRVDRAVQLLCQSSAPCIDNVARASGFAHASHLARATRKRLGVTPAQVRSTLIA